MTKHEWKPSENNKEYEHCQRCDASIGPALREKYYDSQCPGHNCSEDKCHCLECAFDTLPGGRPMWWNLGNACHECMSGHKGTA